MYGVLVQASASVGWCARQHNSKAAPAAMAELEQRSGFDDAERQQNHGEQKFPLGITDFFVL
jgi:hypothetical protein